MKYTFLPMQV